MLKYSFDLDTTYNLNSLLDLSIGAAIKAGEKILEFTDLQDDIKIKHDNSPLTLADLESDRIINEYLESTKIPILSEESQKIDYSVRKNWSRFWLVDPLDGTKEFIQKIPEYSVNISLIENKIPVIGVVYIPAMQLLYYAGKDIGSFKVDLKITSMNDLRSRSVLMWPFRNKHTKPILMASRSHLSEETMLFIEKIKSVLGECDLISHGSSMKFCLIAEGKADIYPRFGPTMEWDTAASQAIVEYAGARILRIPDMLTMSYNKENLINPSFVVCNKEMEETILKIIK